MVCYNLQWSRITCSMKKQEEKTWARIIHRLLSQRTRGGGRLEILRGMLNPEVSQNRKENSSVSTVTKKVTYKETARLGKIYKKIRKFRLRQKNKIPLLSHPKPKRVQSMWNQTFKRYCRRFFFFFFSYLSKW